MKTPISYYGGKQNLTNEILPLIPEHTQYVEAFCGGAAVFWAKKPSFKEVLNDMNLGLITFYKCLKNNFPKLQEKIKDTLHHEHTHEMAKAIMLSGEVSDLDLAHAFWVQSQMSFSFRVFGGFAFDNGRRCAPLTRSKRESFSEIFYERIKDVEIFSRDAIDLIKTKDEPNTFMYLDPPYAESDCGHYEAGKNVYYELLDLLPILKCKWLMSSYPSEQLTKLRELHGWNHKDIEQALSVSGKHNAGKTKTECLTWNYELPNKQSNIFDDLNFLTL